MHMHKCNQCQIVKTIRNLLVSVWAVCVSKRQKVLWCTLQAAVVIVRQQKKNTTTIKWTEEEEEEESTDERKEKERGEATKLVREIYWMDVDVDVLARMSRMQMIDSELGDGDEESFYSFFPFCSVSYFLLLSHSLSCHMIYSAMSEHVGTTCCS